MVLQRNDDLWMLQESPASYMAGPQRQQASATGLDRKAQAEKALEGNLKLRQRLQRTLEELEACAQENAAVMARLEAAVSSSQAIRCRSRLGEPKVCLLLPGDPLAITFMIADQHLQEMHFDEAASELQRQLSWCLIMGTASIESSTYDLHDLCISRREPLTY